MNPMESYERDGYAIFRNVLDAELIREASEHVEWLQRKHPDIRPEKLDWFLVLNDPFWVRLVADDRLLDIAEKFIGPNIALFASHYFAKPSHDGLPVLWHQDGSYWPLDPCEVVTLWLAVDDSTPENGCLRVIPGTHTLAFQEHVKDTSVENVLSSGIAGVDERSVVDVILKAGDVSVHHPNLIHGSDANTSDRRRCGLTIRYIPTSTRITKPIGAPFLLRGAAVPGINAYRAHPDYREGEHFPFRGAS
jgi:phytanoyl-CoA hydroxylase